MNESILNGLLNLFAVFASIVKIEKDEATEAVHSYLSTHFGVRSHKEHIELYHELRSLYDDSLYAINKENVVHNICKQMKAKLGAEEQLLLLVRFMEFARRNSDGFGAHLQMFRTVSEIFRIPQAEFDDACAFIEGLPSASGLTIGAGEACQVGRRGMEGEINVWYIGRFGRYLLTYRGRGAVFMNDVPLAPGVFYTWQHSSVVKGPHFRPVYFSDLQAVFNKDKQKDRVFLSGRKLHFRFGHSSAGLHNFSFNLESGQLVAVMGGSGVGKSTLLSILNGSLPPNEGEVCLNGCPVGSDRARRLIGFVPQDDLLTEELSVFRNLWFTARLCFDGLSPLETEERVNRVLEDLELKEIKDLEVGSPLKKIISGGQRKRLNIAMELIREPAVLYLDEPTSGLSSSDSEKVMMLLKEQTHKGKLVVVNIHQPSSEIYKLFDRLWLLDKGGYPIYDGNPIEAITYFKHAAKYTDRDLSVCAACGNVNPELILNIIDSKKIDDSGKQTDVRKFTPAEWHEMYLGSRPTFEAAAARPLPDNRRRRPGWLKQFLIFSDRNVRGKAANLQYLLIALLEAPLLAWIVALLTRFAPEAGYALLWNKNFVSYIFMSIIVVSFIGLSVSAEEIIRDRAVLKRERFLRLSRSSYLSSKALYLFVLSGLQTFLYIVVGNSVVQVGREMFFAWWSVLWATSFLANLTGLWLSQTLRSVVSIYITIPLLLIPQILLCGLVIRFDDLHSGSSTDDNLVPLVGEIIPARWAFEALMVEQFTGNSYNRLFFPVRKEQFAAQYYKDVHLPAVRSLAGRAAQGDWAARQTVVNELPRLGKAARLPPPPAGESNASYLNKADSALRLRAHNFTAYLEQKQAELIGEKGSEWLNRLKQTSHNEAVEQLVTGQGNPFYKIAGHRIYPRIGQIYLEPESPLGRAPFYSHEKRIGAYALPACIFNLIVMAFFAVLAIIAIFAEIPGKYLRRRNEY